MQHTGRKRQVDLSAVDQDYVPVRDLEYCIGTPTKRIKTMHVGDIEVSNELKGIGLDKLNSSVSTGHISGGALSINTGTTFDLDSGTGVVVTSDPLTAPDITVTPVEWKSQTNIAIPDIGVQTVTYVLIDSVGDIVLTAFPPNTSEQREFIFIGLLTHALGTLTAATLAPNYCQSPMSQLRDLGGAIGYLNTSGNGLVSKYPSLKFLKNAGSLFSLSSNYVNDPTNPNSLTLSEVDTGVGGLFAYAMRNGTSSTVSLTDIVPNILDDGTNYPGTTFGNLRWGVTRVFTVGAGGLFLAPPQFDYGSKASAEDAILTENFVLSPALSALGMLVGYIVVRGNCTSLQNEARAKLINAGKFGTASTSTTVSTLQTSYDSSIVPQILVDDAKPFTLQTTVSGDNFLDKFAVKDDSGTSHFIVTGNGDCIGRQFAGVTGNFGEGTISRGLAIPRTLYGSIDILSAGDSIIDAGSGGWTLVPQVTTGMVSITFDTVFASVPSVVATCIHPGSAARVMETDSITTTGLNFYCVSGQGGRQDDCFCFIAVGI